MKHLGGRVLYFYEPELLGEDGTLLVLSDWIDEYTVVVNGDTLTNLDLKRMFDLSGGNAIKFMDGDVYAGVRIIPPKGLITKETKYYDPEAWWCDMGTFKGLKRLNNILKNEKASSLWKLRN